MRTERDTTERLWLMKQLDDSPELRTILGGETETDAAYLRGYVEALSWVLEREAEE